MGVETQSARAGWGWLTEAFSANQKAAEHRSYHANRDVTARLQGLGLAPSERLCLPQGPRWAVAKAETTRARSWEAPLLKGSTDFHLSHGSGWSGGMEDGRAGWRTREGGRKVFTWPRKAEVLLGWGMARVTLGAAPGAR